MVKEDIYGGFGKENERSARAWCQKHAMEYESVTALAKQCAEVFDFYFEDDTIPEKLYEVARLALEEDLGDGFGRYMSGILNEEASRKTRASAPVEQESSGQKRARRIQELPQNRIKIGG